MARRKSPEGVELNLAAMLDMAFQILTFFILTFKPAPVEGQIQLRMPPPQPLATEAAKQVAGENPNDKNPVAGFNTLPIHLTATENGMLGQITVVQQNVTVDPSLAMLDAELKSKLGSPTSPFDQVIIGVDPKLKYEELMRVLGVCTHQSVGGDPKNKLSKLSLVEEGNP
ncbi:MAG TPA: biopolymer transporter ExbD [Pirellulales bacterium]|jgi:biopolymer transport protein ExbD|nr:biopolymer transporter ExbD [Pirellulales bacterium]